MTKPPFRAEHVGSLLRPARLKRAARALRAGEIEAAAFAEILESEIARTVKRQEAIGLGLATDGEFRRSSWFGFFFEGIDGFDLADSRFRFHDADGHRHGWQTCFASAPLRRKHPICRPEFDAVAAAVERAMPKASMPSPSAFHFFRGDACRDPAAYPEIEDWWADLLAIYRAEVADLAAAGCRYLQIDEVPLAMLCDSDIAAQVREAGEDPEALVARYIAAANAVLDACPPGITRAMHLCRGNFRSRWMAQGGYEPVAARLFAELNVDAFFLEYDSERAGDFTPLRHLPENKHCVLGLISSKTPVLEPVDDVRRRIDEACAHVDLNRLSLSPQCGFASVAGGNALDEDEQFAKLSRIVEIADAVWGGA